MRIIRLRRFAYSKSGTYGELWTGEKTYFHTIEKPWRDNKVNVSCIPIGLYLIKRGNFQGRYDNYELKDVPGRTFIEMHIANTADDVMGCIGVGMEVNTNKHGVRLGVTDSIPAFKAFMIEMNLAKEAYLHITNSSRLQLKSLREEGVW
jgi:hypothetical protein